MKAEDILPDRQDRIHLGGVEIRKGSVGAFIANARLLLEEELPAEQRRQAEEDLRALLPAIDPRPSLAPLERRHPSSIGADAVERGDA